MSLCLIVFSASRNRADNEEGFIARCDSFRQRCIQWFVRQIQGAGKKPYQWAALAGFVVEDSPLQHWITGFERGKDGADR